MCGGVSAKSLVCDNQGHAQGTVWYASACYFIYQVDQMLCIILIVNVMVCVCVSTNVSKF